MKLKDILWVLLIIIVVPILLYLISASIGCFTMWTTKYYSLSTWGSPERGLLIFVSIFFIAVLLVLKFIKKLKLKIDEDTK